MRRLSRLVPRWMWSALVVSVVVGLGACASGGGQSRHGEMVPIQNVQSLAGRWGGILESSERSHDDFIDITINPDGTFQAGGARTIGVLEGRGTLAADGGRLKVTGEKSTGLGTLYDKDGKRTLVIEITTNNGRKFTARLLPR